MESAFVSYQDSSLHYLYGGNGKRLLVCFHGFGESADHFSFLESHLKEVFTIVAIDLPYHGKTIWKRELDIDPYSLADAIQKIKQSLGFTHTKYELLGYSMGGRISLSLIEADYVNIEKVVLLAADGFKVNFWYWLATQTYFGNKLFAVTINNPTPFLWVVKQLHRAGMINQSIHKYVYVHLHEKEKRKQLYLRWTCLRKFRPQLKNVRASILKQELFLLQFYGKHDRIILPNRGQEFSNSIQPHGKVEILNCGHRLLDEKYIQPVLTHLLQ